jgi:hypothetical protein
MHIAPGQARRRSTGWKLIEQASARRERQQHLPIAL